MSFVFVQFLFQFFYNINKTLQTGICVNSSSLMWQKHKLVQTQKKNRKRNLSCSKEGRRRREIPHWYPDWSLRKAG